MALTIEYRPLDELQPDPRNVKAKPNETGYRCPGCGREATSVPSLSTHVGRSHPDDAVALLLDAYIVRCGPNECWPWLGTSDGAGYAVLAAGGRQRRVSRLVLGLSDGDEHQACHRCDNPPCVNRRHLFAATAAENQHDKAAKGRAVSGEDHPASKLTVEQVAEIRARLAAGGETKTAIGADYGVSRTSIYWIEQGRNW